jgi:hypothetical protein
MRSHLLDFDLLSKATYKTLPNNQLLSALKPDFEAFLRERARLVHAAASLLAEGKQVGVETISTLAKSTAPA